ncbi:EAL domain-containing protein [Pseudomaricurvus alkylphenolicus]|uniref:putative bifunctional diguanylate cyclase/phosphodiesterase n=1 Tax=Pseudomaricurvus alkylphenolicus TaxID=1306991 RepID=UPI00141FBA46|nr:GGDEF domain-containing response regulator [Pseudomaricurvus alkylphenolicus]NIB39423.1 EAL domain-containing protein [Pseudomaricurvus alkylphenolicus]
MDTFIKILLINRQESEYQSIRNLLAQVHHTDYLLTWVDRLDRALEETLSEHFDVILLDYHWPSGDAADVLTGARAQGCKVPIIVMTNEMEADVDRSAIRAGASDYLIKGRIDCQLLERTLRYAIERKAAEHKLARLAHYDPLTGIPNRILFRDRLEHAILLAERDQAPFTLMYLDLDGFKQVNDNFGHDAGDELIRTCAQRLCDCMRKSDSVARIGGDEFTLLLEHTESTGDIAHIAEKVIDVLACPFQIGSHQVMIGCSIGIAVYPEAGSDINTLQKHADMAMYEAKQFRGSHYHFFTEELNREARRQLQLESDLQRALRRQEFVLYYQPRVDLRSGEVVALEALLRWSHPERGLVHPQEFMPVAEETGLIVPLGYWVLRQAIEDLKRIQAEGLGQLKMAINLSLRQFSDDLLVERIGNIVRDTGANPVQLEFEITETALRHSPEQVEQCMKSLATIGCRFTLDDFGSGYSSLRNLQRLPLSALKIERQLVENLCRSSEQALLVSSMVALGRSLGKQVIAEGVENQRQLELLRQFGCHQFQGFHGYRPSSYHVLCEILSARLVSNCQ